MQILSHKMGGGIDVILPPSHHWFLWRLSWLSLFSSLYALHQKHYYLALVPFSVFVTSVMYWCHPDYSWRRYLDMFVVHGALFYQLYRGQDAENREVFYVVIFVACCFYPTVCQFTFTTRKIRGRQLCCMGACTFLEILPIWFYIQVQLRQ